MIHGAQLEMHSIGQDLLPAFPAELRQSSGQECLIMKIQRAEHQSFQILKIVVAQNILLQRGREVGVLG